MSQDEPQPRATLPEHGRSVADRNPDNLGPDHLDPYHLDPYHLDKDLLHAGVNAAKKQFFADHLTSEGDKVDLDSSPTDQFSPLGDAFGDFLKGAFNEDDMLANAQAPLRKMLEGLDFNQLSGLLDNSELLETMIRLWSSQAKMWGEFVNEAYGLNARDPNREFADITGINPGGSPVSAVVISNHPAVQVDLYWNDGIPAEPLFVVGPFPLGQKRKTAPKGLGINIRRSLDGLTQVFDVSAPEKLAPGNYAGIIVSEAGEDFGHFSIAFSAA